MSESSPNEAIMEKVEDEIELDMDGGAASKDIPSDEVRNSQMSESDALESIVKESEEKKELEDEGEAVPKDILSVEGSHPIDVHLMSETEAIVKSLVDEIVVNIDGGTAPTGIPSKSSSVLAEPPQHSTNNSIDDDDARWSTQDAKRQEQVLIEREKKYYDSIEEAEKVVEESYKKMVGHGNKIVNMHGALKRRATTLVYQIQDLNSRLEAKKGELETMKSSSEGSTLGNHKKATLKFHEEYKAEALRFDHSISELKMLDPTAKLYHHTRPDNHDQVEKIVKMDLKKDLFD